ncbi:HNH endonuclease [Micromonospora sp. NPDC049900]|uniref:HNH endonuclease n=1 Tax=Micromonospora sp. NPDC049900 TaxID=3364275 RepID=UPI00378D420A
MQAENTAGEIDCGWYEHRYGVVPQGCRGSAHGGRTVIYTDAATSPAEAALVARLSHGRGTAREALHYFRTHGFPGLHSTPTYDMGNHLWHFTDAAPTVGTGADSGHGSSTTATGAVDRGSTGLAGSTDPWIGVNGGTHHGASVWIGSRLNRRPGDLHGGHSDRGPTNSRSSGGVTTHPGASAPDTHGSGAADSGGTGPGRTDPVSGDPSETDTTEPGATSPDATTHGSTGTTGPGNTDDAGVTTWPPPDLTKEDWWRLCWGSESLLLASGSGTTGDPLVFPPDTIVVPPRPLVPAHDPTRPAEREYATAEEEWEVAKQSAWNWLFDQAAGISPVVGFVAADWRYPEPPESEIGRAYELRRAYDTMQNFLNVASFAMGLVTPIIVESAITSGISSRLLQWLKVFIADETGSLVIGGTLNELREARAALMLRGAEVTDEAISLYVRYKRAYERERHFMAIDGAPFEGFEDHIFPGGDVHIGWLTGYRARDVELANKLAGISRLPPSWVWHHHPDFGRMVLIPRQIHEQVRHWGGVSIWSRLFGIRYR